MPKVGPIEVTRKQDDELGRLARLHDSVLVSRSPHSHHFNVVRARCYLASALDEHGELRDDAVPVAVHFVHPNGEITGG